LGIDIAESVPRSSRRPRCGVGYVLTGIWESRAGALSFHAPVRMGGHEPLTGGRRTHDSDVPASRHWVSTVARCPLRRPPDPAPEPEQGKAAEENRAKQSRQEAEATEADGDQGTGGAVGR
jgi:hypothetical protein